MYYTVMLESFGTKKINVIKAVRQVCGCDLVEAKYLVESTLPAVLLIAVDETTAKDAEMKIDAEGATTYDIPVDESILAGYLRDNFYMLRNRLNDQHDTSDYRAENDQLRARIRELMDRNQDLLNTISGYREEVDRNEDELRGMQHKLFETGASLATYQSALRMQTKIVSELLGE